MAARLSYRIAGQAFFREPLHMTAVETLSRRAGVGSGVFRLVCLSIVLAAVGCGGKDKLVTVEGKATVNGAPLPGGMVTFNPVDTKGKSAIGAVADGVYKLTTDGKSGAPVGKYKVSYSSPAPAGFATGDPSSLGSAPPPAARPRENLVAPKYEGIGTTDMIIEVVASPSPGTYDLKFTR